MTFTLSSNGFTQEALIPEVYTCDGKDISPELVWEGAPENTKSFVMIFDDPDAPAGTWDHWILFNIPADTNSLPENLNALPAGTKEGVNSWGRTGYGGPCPPDRLHRYYFKLYALDALLDLADGVGKADIERAMQAHIVAQTELMGRYNRPGNPD